MEISFDDREATRDYLRVVKAGFFWWFSYSAESELPFAAGIRAQSTRWTFAYAEGETIEGAVVGAFAKAADVFPGLKGLYVKDEPISITLQSTI